MSASSQRKFLLTIGISLVTMLVLAVSQALIQLSRLLDSNQAALLLWLLFPLFALLSGAAARFMVGSLWSVLLISLGAFTVVILVLFSPAALVYSPLYILLSLGGYASAGWLKKRERRPAG